MVLGFSKQKKQVILITLIFNLDSLCKVLLSYKDMLHLSDLSGEYYWNESH